MAPAASLSGGIVGLINGLVITTLRIVPFIATLGMLGIARGAAKYFADQQTVNAPATWINELAVTFPSRPWMLVAPGVWLVLLLAVAKVLQERYGAGEIVKRNKPVAGPPAPEILEALSHCDLALVGSAD